LRYPIGNLDNLCTIHEIQDDYCKNAEPISVSAFAVV